MNILTFLVIGAVLTILGIIITVFYVKSFRHVFVAKFLTGGKPVMRVYKCRQKKDKDSKSLMWIPFGTGLKPFAKPHEDVIIPNFQKKNSWYAEGYVNREGEVIQYIKDVPDLLDSKIKPFAIEQRTITVNQFRKAEAKRQTGFEKYIPMIATFGFLLLLVILVASFYPKMIEPMNENLAESRSFQSEYLTRVENITQNLQIASTRLAEGCGNVQVVE